MQPISLEDFLLIAEAVLGRPAREIARAMSIPRAEAALHAPFAAYEGIELYPLVHQKAGVLGARLLSARPLPDGNKRVALVCAIELVERNGGRWTAPPGGERETAATIERLALGRLSEREFVAWVRDRLML
jgi:prophage maintenance system killer protein